ncbi:MAG TPA: hypothetical protein PKL13_04680 [bacterium]|nr:hypothetical protein [bacterium]
MSENLTKIAEGSQEETEAEVWELLKAKAETFEQLQWVWENTFTDNSTKRDEILQLLKVKAKSLEQCEWVLKRTPEGSERDEVWQLLMAKVETFEQFQWVWENTFTNCLEREKNAVLRSLMTKVKTFETFEQFQWVWERISASIPERTVVLRFLKAKAETFEQCKWLWKNIDRAKQDEGGFDGLWP